MHYYVKYEWKYKKNLEASWVSCICLRTVHIEEQNIFTKGDVKSVSWRLLGERSNSGQGNMSGEWCIFNFT